MLLYSLKKILSTAIIFFILSSIPCLAHTRSLIPLSNLGFCYSPITSTYEEKSQCTLGTWFDTKRYPTYALWDGSSWTNSGGLTEEASSIYPATGSSKINTIYDKKNQTLIATWIGKDFHPSYAVWDGSYWITTGAIIASPAHSNNVQTQYSEDLEEVFATWIDSDNLPNYAIWNGSFWTTGLIGNSPTASGDISLVYDTHSKSFMATWIDATSYHPLYSVYVEKLGWNEPLVIDTIPVNATEITVYLTSHPTITEGTIIALWTDTHNIPVYALWNGSWSSATAIPGATPARIPCCYSFAYDEKNKNMLATWVSKRGTPAYATWKEAWSKADCIFDPQLETISYDIPLTYDPHNRTIIATWIDENSSPMCAKWNSLSWSEPTSLDQFSACSAVATTYNTNTQTTTSIWFDPDGILAYTIHPSYPLLSSVLPPTNIKGESRTNRTAFTKQTLRKLSWNASLSDDITHYNIYRDQDLIASVLVNNPLTYNDYISKNNQGNFYSITAINKENQESTTASIFLK